MPSNRTHPLLKSGRFHAILDFVRDSNGHKRMRIDIVPEGNKTKREGGESIFGSALLFDTIFGGVKNLLESVTSSIASAVDEVVSTVLRRAFVILLGVFGIWFLFSGFASLLDFLYGLPGIGEIVVGVLVFAAAIIVSAFSRAKK